MKLISKTTEYAFTLAVLITDLATCLAGVLPAKAGAYAAAVVTIGYQVSRGLAKFNANPSTPSQ
jgi:hypothetical protein